MVGVFVWNILLLGIIFNAAASILLKPIKGIDAMPSIPIVIGYLYGAAAGIEASAIIAVAYYAINLRSIHYTPLTITANATVAFLASFLTGFDILLVGIGLLFVYHIISGSIVSVFGGLRPGYFAFIALNIATSAAIFYISSFAL